MQGYRRRIDPCTIVSNLKNNSMVSVSFLQNVQKFVSVSNYYSNPFPVSKCG